MTDPEAKLVAELDNLERNNPDAAEALARAYLDTFQYIPASVAHYLFMLQDDAIDLRRRLTGLDIREDAAPVA